MATGIDYQTSNTQITSNATSSTALALGNTATVGGRNDTVAIGNQANAGLNSSTTVGGEANAAGLGSTSIS